MPFIPHWYVVRGRDIAGEDFADLVRHIHANGRVGHWGVQPRTTHLEGGGTVDGLIYYERGGWRYWTMGYPIDEETIINRESVDRKGIRWANKGPVQGRLFE